ncbi:MAG: hypothetical protein K5924_05875 [Chloroflexi bacterium]|nr:hypothetical protein [Chloroflexota bacterium]
MPVLAALLLVLAACAAPGVSPDPATSPPGGSDDPGGSDGIEHPEGSEAILVVDTSGGFVPVEFMATRMPMFVLLGDGRVIMQGPQTLEFPGPAYPALIERTLTEDGIQAVLKAVEQTNLFTRDLELRGAQNMVADAADHLFILNAGGQDVTVSVYGLGTLMPDVEPMPGITSGEIEAHRILGLLNDGLMTLDSWLPDGSWEAEGWQPYEPEAFRLYVRDSTDEPLEGDLQVQVREWPTDDDPATFGDEDTFFGNGTRCGVVDGELGAAWLAELAASNQMTRWSHGDRQYTVLPRPVLPHEDPACPPLDGAA